MVKRFFYVSYKNFSRIEKIFKENQFKKIVTSEPDDNFITCRSNSIAFANINSDWNSDLCARILRFFNHVDYIFIKNNKKFNYEKTLTSKKNIFDKIKNILNILMVKLNIINKEIFFL